MWPSGRRLDASTAPMSVWMLMMQSMVSFKQSSVGELSHRWTSPPPPCSHRFAKHSALIVDLEAVRCAVAIDGGVTSIISVLSAFRVTKHRITTFHASNGKCCDLIHNRKPMMMPDITNYSNTNKHTTKDEIHHIECHKIVSSRIHLNGHRCTNHLMVSL